MDMSHFNVLQKTTRDREYAVMSETYLWWRAARATAGYLEDCYKASNIATRTTKSQINFNPLLRLVTSGKILGNDLMLWSKALQAVHVEFEKNPNHFTNEPVASLCHFIKQKGGKTGLAGYHFKGDASNEPDVSVKAIEFYELNESEYLPVLQSEARRYYATKMQIAVGLPALQLTDDGYSVVVVRKHAAGYSLVGTTQDKQLIDTALVNTYRSDFDALPLTMRVLLEPLHVLNIPNVLASSREKFIEVSNLINQWDPDRKKERAYKRLLYVADQQTFLVSNMQMKSSVVVKAKPKTELLEKPDSDLFLRGSTRLSIETRLLHQSAYNLFKPSSADVFTKTLAEAFTYCSVQLETKLDVTDEGDVTAHELKLHTPELMHPSLSLMPFYEMFGQPRFQVINKDVQLNPLWQCDVTLEWLRTAMSELFDRWIVKYGKKANRQENKTLDVAFSKTEMTIAYEFDISLGFDSLKVISIPSGAASGDVNFSMRSADFAFVFRQIADLNVTSSIRMEATEDVLMLKFATTCSEYECWIPACDERGNRSASHFTEYYPIESKSPALTVDPEDDVPEVTKQEMLELKERLELLKIKKSAA